MTLTVRLDPEEELKLQGIIAAMAVPSQSEAIRKLINDKFEELQLGRSFLERRGEPPKHLLNGQPTLSSRETRKKLIGEHIAQRESRRKGRRYE